MLTVTPTPAPLPMATKEKTFYAQLGRRIAERRKAQGMTQVELAGVLGIAQQTMAHYEGGVSRVAVAHLATIAQTLHTTVEDLIGEAQARKAHGKRGPAPKIQQQLERVSTLPKARQRLISEVLDSMLAQSP